MGQHSSTPDQHRSTGEQKQLLLTSLYQVLSNTNNNTTNDCIGNTNISTQRELLDVLTFLPYNEYTVLLKQIQSQHTDTNTNCTLIQLIQLFECTTIGDIINFTALLLKFLALLNTPNKLNQSDNQHSYSTHASTDPSPVQTDAQSIWNSIGHESTSHTYNCIDDNNINAHELSDDLLHTAKALHNLTTRLQQPVDEYRRSEHFSEEDDEDDITPATTNQLTQAFTSTLIRDLGPLLKSQRTIDITSDISHTHNTIKSPHIQPLPLLRLSTIPTQQLDLLSVRQLSSSCIQPLLTSTPKHQCTILPPYTPQLSPMLRAASIRKQSIHNDSIIPLQLSGKPYWSDSPCDLYIQLCGQSMLQCDIRLYERGQLTIDALNELLQSDIVFTEIETAIVNEKYQHETIVNSSRNNNPMFFHAAEPHVLDILQSCKFNIIEAANNHVGDLGDAGLLSMLDELRLRNISFAGIGENLSIASSYSYIETQPHIPYCTNTYKVAHCAFASKVPAGTEATENRIGVHTLSMTDTNEQTLDGIDTLRIWSTLTLARQQCDIVIAYHHNHYWERKAVNEEGKVMGWRLEFARRCIDFGATMYIAHGAPRLQGIEIYKGCPIFYCLGNFMFQTKTAISFYGDEVWQSVVVDIQYHANKTHHNGHTHSNTNNNSPSTPHKLRTVNPASQSNSDRQFMSYTIKLIPIVLNEIGDTDCHLQTRGLPSKAEYTDAMSILQRLQLLSAEFGTIITVDSTDPYNVVGYIVDGKSSDISIDTFESHQMSKTNKQHIMSKSLARPKSYGGDILTQQLTDLLPTQHNNTAPFVSSSNTASIETTSESQVDSYGRFMNTYKQFKNSLKLSQSQHERLNHQLQDDDK